MVVRYHHFRKPPYLYILFPFFFNVFLGSKFTSCNAASRAFKAKRAKSELDRALQVLFALAFVKTSSFRGSWRIFRFVCLFVCFVCLFVCLFCFVFSSGRNVCVFFFRGWVGGESKAVLLWKNIRNDNFFVVLLGACYLLTWYVAFFFFSVESFILQFCIRWAHGILLAGAKHVEQTLQCFSDLYKLVDGWHLAPFGM